MKNNKTLTKSKLEYNFYLLNSNDYRISSYHTNCIDYFLCCLIFAVPHFRLSPFFDDAPFLGKMRHQRKQGTLENGSHLKVSLFLTGEPRTQKVSYISICLYETRMVISLTSFYQVFDILCLCRMRTITLFRLMKINLRIKFIVSLNAISIGKTGVYFFSLGQEP